MRTNDPNSVIIKRDPRWDRAITALVTEPNFATACSRVGIDLPTLQSWLLNPEFARLFREARRDIRTHIAQSTLYATLEALEHMRLIVADSSLNTSARVSAARLIIETGEKVTQHQDIERRIDELETAVKGKRASDAEQTPET